MTRDAEEGREIGGSHAESEKRERGGGEIMATMDVRRVFLVFVLCSVVVSCVQGIWLSLPATGTKCVSEEIQTNVVVLADFAVVSDEKAHDVQLISVKV